MRTTEAKHDHFEDHSREWQNCHHNRGAAYRQVLMEVYTRTLPVTNQIRVSNEEKMVSL